MKQGVCMRGRGRFEAKSVRLGVLWWSLYISLTSREGLRGQQCVLRRDVVIPIEEVY